MPGWVGIVLWIISNAPELISAIKTLLDLLKKFPRDRREQVKAELAEAIKNKDKSKIHEVLKKECSGVGCSMDVKD